MLKANIMNQDFAREFLNEVALIANTIDATQIEKIVNILKDARRVFVIGVGGSAGNASHMVNDLRKLCNIEAYCPTDNASEVTARTNDEGFDTIFVKYLETSRMSNDDVIFVLSVGGGNKEKNVSIGLISAIDYCKELGAKVVGVVGRPDGYTSQNADACVVVPVASPARITPHSEAFQAVVWHCIVSHPDLQINATKW
jgi:D-sedoheptulose 7-phosphate isomerase